MPTNGSAKTRYTVSNAGNVPSTTRFAARPTLTQYTEAGITAAVNSADPDNQVSRRSDRPHFTGQ